MKIIMTCDIFCTNILILALLFIRKKTYKPAYSSATQLIDCKTVRIFAYSSTREERVTLTPRVTDFFTAFEKKTDCFAVYSSQ